MGLILSCAPSSGAFMFSRKILPPPQKKKNLEACQPKCRKYGHFLWGCLKKKTLTSAWWRLTGKVLGFDSYCEEMDRVLETIHQRQSEILGDRNGSRQQRRYIYIYIIYINVNGRWKCGFLLLFLLVVFYFFMIRGIQGGLGIYDHI